MLRYIFILFFIVIHVSASSNEAIKIKAIHKVDTVYVKTVINYHTMTYKEAERQTGDESNVRFISHIRANISNRTVFDAYTSPYVARFSRFTFTYICREKNDTLNISATDNKGMRITQHRKIKRYPSENYQKKQIIGIHLIDYRKEKPDIWKEISIENAIKELYGAKNIILEPEPEQICGSYLRMPLKIQTGKNIRSIAIFQDHRIRPTVAIFNTPVNENNNLTLSISTERDDGRHGGEGNLTIILENTDGNLHKIIQKYVVAGMHEFCYGNEVKSDL